jgi:hypothetical protein
MVFNGLAHGRQGAFKAAATGQLRKNLEHLSPVFCKPFL